MSITQRVKRSLVLGAAGAMVLSLLPAGIAAANTVETDGSAACEGSEGRVDFNDALGFFDTEIECMAAYGITQGDAEGNYNSTGNVTRQQMAQFIARLATQATSGDLEIPEADEDVFDDIAGINADARNAINFLASFDPPIVAGVGDGDSYNPGGNVTRQQMASFIARAHEALGVDFSGNEDPIVFPDADDIAEVHAGNIDLLTGAGIIAGRNDGTFGPGADITRGQMSSFIVRSIVVLDDQGLWNGVFLPVEGDLSLTLLAGDVVGNETVSTDVRSELDGDENLLALSTGSEVITFQFSTTEDSFFIDGEAATPAAFLGAADTGDVLEVTEVSGGFEHNLVTQDIVLSGVIGEGPTTGFAIVEPVSGVILQDITAEILDGDEPNEFTVDGAAADLDEFLDNISFGDTIEVEVVVEGDNADFADSILRHNLSNEVLSGTVVEIDGSLLVDVNADDAGDPLLAVDGSENSTDGVYVPGFDVDDLDGSDGDIDDDYELTIDGDDETVDDFAAVLAALDGGENGEINYQRVENEDGAGDVTIDFDSTDAGVTQTGIVDTVAADGATVTFHADTNFGADPIDPSNYSVVRLNGSIVAVTDLDELLTAGDVATATIGFDEDEGDVTLAFTTADLEGTVTDVTVDTSTVEVDLGGGASAEVVVTAEPFNYDNTTIAYFVDGAQTTRVQFLDALDDADLDDEDVSFVAVDGNTRTEYRVTFED